ncbi:MAG: hypothetical protein J6Z82_01180 [Schwartzia sp.]|nr:hypothetical protein [Schwartzia sp. (in: firmicutes)]
MQEIISIITEKLPCALSNIKMDELFHGARRQEKAVFVSENGIPQPNENLPMRCQKKDSAWGGVFLPRRMSSVCRFPKRRRCKHFGRFGIFMGLKILHGLGQNFQSQIVRQIPKTRENTAFRICKF